MAIIKTAHLPMMVQVHSPSPTAQSTRNPSQLQIKSSYNNDHIFHFYFFTFVKLHRQIHPWMFLTHLSFSFPLPLGLVVVVRIHCQRSKVTTLRRDHADEIRNPRDTRRSIQRATKSLTPSARVRWAPRKLMKRSCLGSLLNELPILVKLPLN